VSISFAKINRQEVGLGSCWRKGHKGGGMREGAERAQGEGRCLGGRVHGRSLLAKRIREGGERKRVRACRSPVQKAKSQAVNQRAGEKEGFGLGGASNASMEQRRPSGPQWWVDGHH